jgi:plasmid maintenance system antidote protein VapI
MKRKPYATVQEWMERTGTSTDKLAKLARIDRSHLSKILSRSRRCSLEKALRLSMVTSVPVETLIRWMADGRDSRSQIEQPFNSQVQ